MMKINESIALEIKNPILTPGKAFTESSIEGVNLAEVRAIYPLIRAINSDRLTKNFTFYPRECLIGRKGIESSTGYASFVTPFGKPIITEHRAQDSWDGTTADVPMGRVIAAGYKKASKEDPQTPPKNKMVPGTIEGSGHMWLVPAITDAVAIERILGRIYHTVSIGSNVEKVIESISGEDLVSLNRNGKEMPPYYRGQVYEGKLSYWTMMGLNGYECSYVNRPADERAGTLVTDIGLNGVQLLLGEKKLGSKEYCFFDIKTKEKVTLDPSEVAFDEAFCEDSLPNAFEWFKVAPLIAMGHCATESVELVEGAMVSWGFGEGQIVSIHSLGQVPGVPVAVEATPNKKYARIQVYKDGKATENFVAHQLNYLKGVKN